MTRKKTHEKYVEELKVKNPDIEVVDKYVNNKTKIMHHCLIHDIYWKTTPERVLNGAKCPQCKKETLRLLKAKTHEEYVKEVANINSNIEVLGIYINAKTPIKHHCLKHNIYWDAIPDNILKGMGCVECGKEKYSAVLRKTHDQYVKEVKKINPDIIVLDYYINNFTPILHKCRKHNIVWMTSPAVILRGGGCVECGKEKLRNCHIKSHDTYVEELSKTNSNIVVLEEYKGTNTSILHKCLIDGYEWMAQPANILHGYGCPVCNISHGERNTQKWLEKHQIKYIPQKTYDDCKDKKVLPFDFYLPDYNVCIEYQGEQHYRPVEYFGGEKQFEIQQKHDQIKRNYCKHNNIKLLEIPYWEDIEKALNNFLFI